jgi:hypothetical protein
LKESERENGVADEEKQTKKEIITHKDMFLVFINCQQAIEILFISFENLADRSSE